MPEPSSPSSMIAEDVEREIRELERFQQNEELRRLRARAGNSEQEPREGGSRGSESKRTNVSDQTLPPPSLEECSTYDMYKNKLQEWELEVNISKKKKAAMLILSLTK